jgi:hypothetical protein
MALYSGKEPGLRRKASPKTSGTMRDPYKKTGISVLNVAWTRGRRDGHEDNCPGSDLRYKFDIEGTGLRMSRLTDLQDVATIPRTRNLRAFASGLEVVVKTLPAHTMSCHIQEQVALT